MIFIYSISVWGQNNELRTLPSEIFKVVRKNSKDTVNWTWKFGGTSNANLGQTSLKNWAAGGENFSISASVYQNLYLYFKKNKRTWDTNADINFAYLQTTSQGGRKNDDRLNITSKYGYKLDSLGKVSISILYDLRTQFFDGHKYFKKDSSVIISTFFSPNYQLFSLGFDCKFNKNFSVFLSPITSRFTIIPSKKIAENGLFLPAGKQFLAQPGAFASINFSKDNFIKNVNYKTRIDLFSNYIQNPQNVDFLMNNLLSFRINKFMSATYSLDLIYDDDLRIFGDRKIPAL